MSALSLSSPFPIFTDTDGSPLDSGYIYIGTAGLNPETNPIQAYWDSALTIPAAQPVRTIGGYPSRSGSAARIYINADDCAILIKNSNGNLIFSALNQTNAIPAGTITFTQSGTGAVARTLQDKARESVSVADFGASTAATAANNSTYIAAALAAHEHVIVPSGTFNINDLTVPSGKTLEFQDGAILSVASAKTLTVNGQIKAGLNQIFAGAGSFVIAAGETLEVVPQWWGASPSASAATNTAAIQSSLNALQRIGGTTISSAWKLPIGYYHINDEIFFPKASETTVEVTRSVLKFEGTLAQDDDTKNGITFGKLYHTRIEGLKIYGPLTNQMTNSKAAITFNAAVANCYIGIDYCYGGGTYGVNWTPTTGSSSWNEITLGTIRNWKYGFHVTCDGSVNHFFNANKIHGGDFANQYTTAGTTTYGIVVTGYNYSNTWYSQGFAQLNTDVKWTNAIGFAMIAPYYDTPSAYEIAADLTACHEGTWVHGYSPYPDLTFVFSDCRAINFHGTGKYGTTNPSNIVDQYGILFRSPMITSSGSQGGTIAYSPTGLYHYTQDHQGTYQIINKNGEGAAASAPSSGTYKVGAFVWNTDNIASGQKIGWMCKTEGTAGTLSGVTANTTNGSPIIVVNSAANLKYGQFLTVAGAGITGQIITNISGTSVTMSGNATATLTGAAVSFTAPTWQAGPNYP